MTRSTGIRIIFYVLAILLWLFIGFGFYRSQTMSNDCVIDSNQLFLENISSPVYIEPIVYGSLIDCLIEKESSGNSKAIGDNGLAYGILQFHESTFDYFSEHYRMTYLNYKNPEDQIILCDRMLKDGYGFHWTTYDLCR